MATEDHEKAAAVGDQPPHRGGVTTLFIKRPIMTSLVMIAILFFGIVAYRQLPVSDLPNVDFPTITVTRDPAGREPGDDGGDGRDAAREAVLDDRRHRQHDVDVEPRADADRRAVRARPEHRRGRAGRAGGDRADAAAAAAGHPAAVVSEDESRRRADPDARAHVHRGADLAARRVSARRRSRSGSRWWAAWRRCSCTARRSTRCASSSTRGSSRRAISRSRTSRRRSTNQNVNLPTGVLWGPKVALTVQATGQLENADQFRNMVVAYRNGAPVHLTRRRPRERRRAEQQDRELVQRPARDRARDPATAGNEHREGVERREGGARAREARDPALGACGGALRPRDDDSRNR